MTEQSLSTICLDPPWPLDPDANAVVRVAGRAYCDGWIAAMLRAEPARKPPKPSIRTLVKRAETATGKTVTAITALADGATKLDLGTGEQQQPNAVDEWIAKHADKTQRH